MLTWFYFSESQLERIKPFLFFVSMADASSTVSYTSSSTDFSGRRLLLSTARTRPCTIGFSGGAHSVLQQSLHRAGESDAF